MTSRSRPFASRAFSSCLIFFLRSLYSRSDLFSVYSATTSPGSMKRAIPSIWPSVILSL